MGQDGEYPPIFDDIGMVYPRDFIILSDQGHIRQQYHQ